MRFEIILKSIFKMRFEIIEIDLSKTDTFSKHDGPHPGCGQNNATAHIMTRKYDIYYAAKLYDKHFQYNNFFIFIDETCVLIVNSLIHSK